MIKITSVSKGEIQERHIEDNLSREFNWIDSLMPDSLELKKISDKLKIDINDLKEAVDEDERPRVSESGKYSIIIFKAPFKQNKIIEEFSFAIFFNKTTVLTLRTKDFSVFDDIKHQKYEIKKKMFQNTSYFIFRLLDRIINSYFEILDVIDEKIDVIEREIFENPQKSMVKRMFDIRKTLIYAHKALTANREVITSIEKEYIEDIDKKHMKDFRTLYYDINQLVDIGGTYREVLTGTLDTYLSSVSYNLNKTIKRLTGWGSLILVPTLITGIYGMNFRNMPEIYWKYGYAFSLALMLFSVIILYMYFKSKDWI